MKKAILTILVWGDNSKIYVRQDGPEKFDNGFSFTGFYNETFSYFLKNDFPVWRERCQKITVNFLDFHNRETLAIYPLYEVSSIE